MADISFLELNNDDSRDAIEVIKAIAEEGKVNMFNIDGVIEEVYGMGEDWLVDPIRHNIDEYLDFISEGEAIFERN